MALAGSGAEITGRSQPAGDDVCLDDGTRLGAADDGEVSPLLAPSQGYEQETTITMLAGSGRAPGTGTVVSRKALGFPVYKFPRVEFSAAP